MLEKLKKLLSAMKRIEKDGFPDENDASTYFEEKEVVLEEIGKVLGEFETNYSEEIEALKSTIKTLRDNLKNQADAPRVLTADEFYLNLGKTIAGVWMKNQQMLGELNAVPNFKSESWVNPKDVHWEVGKGWVGKAPLDTPMGDMATNDQYLINPIYENKIMTEAARKSVMMNLVTNRPMSGPSVFLSQRSRGGVILSWLTSYGQEITGSKPEMEQRVELKAYTLAGFIPWYDEFEEDIFADLGRMFVEEFIEAYGREFDTQCLTADAAPYTGALKAAGVESHMIKSSSMYGISFLDFREAALKVPSTERRDCAWFINETVLSRVTSERDTEGRPIWRGPNDGKPGRIDGYPYHECDILPQTGDNIKNAPFAIFMNPKRIKHGNRKGMELKRFDGTTESLKYGEIFLRFRKRDGFLVTRPKKNMVVLKCKGGN